MTIYQGTKVPPHRYLDYTNIGIYTIQIASNNQSDQACEHIPFRQDRHNCMKRKVDEPFKGSRKRLAVTNDGRTIDRVRYRGLVRGRSQSS
jgi:hypothetical protein